MCEMTVWERWGDGFSCAKVFFFTCILFLSLLLNFFLKTCVGCRRPCSFIFSYNACDSLLVVAFPKLFFKLFWDESQTWYGDHKTGEWGIFLIRKARSCRKTMQIFVCSNSYFLQMCSEAIKRNRVPGIITFPMKKEKALAQHGTSDLLTLQLVFWRV